MVWRQLQKSLSAKRAALVSQVSGNRGSPMAKRPLSLTNIAWILIVLGLIGLYGSVTMGSNPAMAKMLAKSPVPLFVNQVWSGIGCLVGFTVAYGIFKGQPWSRVLYVVWSLIQIGVGLYISPMK